MQFNFFKSEEDVKRAIGLDNLPDRFYHLERKDKGEQYTDYSGVFYERVDDNTFAHGFTLVGMLAFTPLKDFTTKIGMNIIIDK